MSGKKSASDVLGKRSKAAKDVDDDDYEPAAEEAPAKKKPRKTITGPKVGHCGMDKKALGDAIKSGLAIEKYGAQRTMVQTTMDVAFFKAFFDTGVAGVAITPSTYDDTTPVVTALFGYAAAGQLFGVSKVKGGNRYTENHIAAVMAVLYPAAKKFLMFFSI
ncbi:hypothetical protein AURDEDRAFT_166170 [Auricularia subglabra TFB-10046 SS5]|nr:hypothetical protein AURDEDRAFT_166170 [Auricularia subglabra TFB-10046 SS5]